MKKVSLNKLKLLLPRILKEAIDKQRQKKLLQDWESKGCPAPPPHIVKQNTIKEYQEKYKHHILVETGTYMGDMVEAQRKKFKRIYSIELGLDLYNKAVLRFRKAKNVTIVHGDSGKVLPELLSKLEEPAIFWLDGHYSAGITAKGEKECPIFEELDAIFANDKFNHILLIDDARCFIGEGDYPTIEQLTEYIQRKNDKYRVAVHHDIIRCIVA